MVRFQFNNNSNRSNLALPPKIKFKEASELEIEQHSYQVNRVKLRSKQIKFLLKSCQWEGCPVKVTQFRNDCVVDVSSPWHHLLNKPIIQVESHRFTVSGCIPENTFKKLLTIYQKSQYLELFFIDCDIAAEEFIENTSGSVQYKLCLNSTHWGNHGLVIGHHDPSSWHPEDRNNESYSTYDSSAPPQLIDIHPNTFFYAMKDLLRFQFIDHFMVPSKQVDVDCRVLNTECVCNQMRFYGLYEDRLLTLREAVVVEEFTDDWTRVCNVLCTSTRNYNDFKTEQQNSQPSECLVCLTTSSSHELTILLPCKHHFVCQKCSAKLLMCPLCRDPITKRLHYTSTAFHIKIQ